MTSVALRFGEYREAIASILPPAPQKETLSYFKGSRICKVWGYVWGIALQKRGASHEIVAHFALKWPTRHTICTIALGAKQPPKKKHTQMITSRDYPGIFGDFVYVFSPP